MKHEQIAFDWATSAREYDNNGFMHVSVSNLTKEQVAPYYGHEIPDWERLGLDPKHVYYGWRSAEELSKPETIKSINGIPIQLGHHLDYPEAPAKETRVGHTGTDGKWQPPYLTNSLTIIDKIAQDAINNGSMKELSLAYAYKPDFTSGETAQGLHYDFVMRNILAQHLALVEAGRAGHDVVVNDHSLEESKMPENQKIEGKEAVVEQPMPDIEKKEIAIGKEIGNKADELVDLHDENGEHVEDEIDLDTFLKSKGLTDEDIARVHEIESAKGADEEPVDEDVENVEAEGEGEGEGEAPVEDEEPNSELFDDDYIKKACEDCGIQMDEESFKIAKYVANHPPKATEAPATDEDATEENEPIEAEDEDLDEDKKDPLAQDAQIKAIEKKIIEKMEAIKTCAPIIGDVKLTAFDSAGDVFASALKKLGVVAGITPENAQACFSTYQAGKRVASSKAIAQDEKPTEEGAIASVLSNVK